MTPSQLKKRELLALTMLLGGVVIALVCFVAFSLLTMFSPLIIDGKGVGSAIWANVLWLIGFTAAAVVAVRGFILNRRVERLEKAAKPKA